jgi:hypothetical protein
MAATSLSLHHDGRTKNRATHKDEASRGNSPQTVAN